MSKTIHKGWVFKHRTRKVDKQLKPITDWGPWFYAYGSKRDHPKIYSTPREAGRNGSVGIVLTPILDRSKAPQWDVSVYPNYSEWCKLVFEPWEKDGDNITGYFMKEQKIVRGELAVDC